MPFKGQHGTEPGPPQAGFQISCAGGFPKHRSLTRSALGYPVCMRRTSKRERRGCRAQCTNRLSSQRQGCNVPQSSCVPGEKADAGRTVGFPLTKFPNLTSLGRLRGFRSVPQTLLKLAPSRKVPAPTCTPGQVGASRCGVLPEVQGTGRQSCLLPPTPSRGAQAASPPSMPGSPRRKSCTNRGAERPQTDARSSLCAWARESEAGEGG